MKTTVCKHLRTKKMFIPAQQQEAVAELQESDPKAFYWCNRTLTELGVDDERVHPQICIPTRCCFEK